MSSWITFPVLEGCVGLRVSFYARLNNFLCLRRVSGSLRVSFHARLNNFLCTGRVSFHAKLNNFPCTGRVCGSEG